MLSSNFCKLNKKIWDDSETLRFNTSIYPLLFYMYLGYHGFLFSHILNSSPLVFDMIHSNMPKNESHFGINNVHY